MTCSGNSRNKGHRASKLRAAKIASWSGVRVVIAAASRPNVLPDAVAGVRGVGTQVQAHDRRLSARKLWIAFAVEAAGRITVDSGARSALVERGVSLLPAGATRVEGNFIEGEAVDLAGPDQRVFARGLSKWSASAAREVIGRRSQDLGDGMPHELVHRDDLVLLPD